MKSHNLPANWEYRELQDVSEIIPGNSPPSETYNKNGDGLPFYQGKSVFGDKFPSANRWCSEPKKIAEEGDVLVSVRAPVGATNMCQEEACIGRGLAAIRPNEDIESLYIFYALRNFKNNLEKEGTGTTFDSISSGELRQFELPIAPLEEQRRIVTKTEELLTKIEAGVNGLNNVKEMSNNYTASLVQNAITGALTEEWRKNKNIDAEKDLEKILEERKKICAGKKSSSYEDPERTEGELELPESWVSASMEQLMYSTRYGTSEKCDYEYGGFPVLRIPNIRENKIKLDDMKYTKSEVELSNIDPLSKGDFLVIRTNGSEDIIGRGALIEEEFDTAHYFASYLIRFRIVPVEPLPEWVSFVWQSQHIRRTILDRAASSAGQYNLSQSKILDFEIPLPPLKQQRQIITRAKRKLTLADDLITQLEENMTRAERLRRSILNKAFQGKLVRQEESHRKPGKNNLSGSESGSGNGSTTTQRTLQEVIENEIHD